MTKNNSWQTIRFDQICKNISDRIDDPKTSNSNYYVGLEHLDSEEPKILRHGIPQDVSKTKLRFKMGHVLFGKRNWYLRRVAVANFDGICSAHMLVLEPRKEKIIKEFLPILMFGDSFYEKALTISAGSMSPTIRWKDIAKLNFLIPLISEQKKTIKIISVIDESVTKTQNLLYNLKTYKESKANDLLTRGVGHTKFKKVQWLFEKEIEIPEEWEIKPMSEIQKITMGQSPPSESYNQEKRGLPFYQGVIDFGDIYPNPSVWCTDPKKIADKNTILFSVRAPVGEVNITKTQCCLGRGVAALNPTINDLMYCYYTVIQNKTLFLIYAQGTTYDAINQKDIANVKLPYTKNISEQQKIASILAQLDEQYRQVENHLALLKKMRKSMINEKLTPPTLRKKIVQ